MQEGATAPPTPVSAAKQPEPPRPGETAKAAAPPAAAQPRVSPAAARTAAEKGIDATSVTGTGRGGVVSKADVIGVSERTPAPSGAVATPVAKEQPAPQRPAAAPTAAGERETREKMSTRRKRIAEHLLE